MSTTTHNLSRAAIRQRQSRARRGAAIFRCVLCGTSSTALPRDADDRSICAGCGETLRASGCVRCRDCHTITPIADCAPQTCRCRPCHKARQRDAQQRYRARRLLNTAPLAQPGLVAGVLTTTLANETSKGINETSKLSEPNETNERTTTTTGGRRMDDDAQAGETPEPAQGGRNQ